MKDIDQSLYYCFTRHLYRLDIDQESDQSFVRQVATSYLRHLIKGGAHVSSQHIDEVITDLEEEVTNMLRVKLYGYFDLNAFRRDERGKKDC